MTFCEKHRGIARLSWLLLAAVMLLALLPGTALANVGGSCGEGVYWDFDETSGLLTISGNGAMDDYEFTIPHYTLDSTTCDSTAPWWPYCNQIRCIMIENGVTSIGDAAFEGTIYIGGTRNCYINLKSVSIADSVISIGYHAFTWCIELSELHLGKNLENIEEWAFAFCYKLKDIDLPDTMTTIGSKAFYGTDIKTSVKIPPSVSFIGESAVGVVYPCAGAYAPIMNFTIIGKKGTEAERYYYELLNRYNNLKADPNFGASSPYYAENYLPGGTIRFVDIDDYTGFSDVNKSDWFAADVQYAVDKGLMKGAGSGRFDPAGTTTRAQTVTVLYRLAGSPKVSGSSFTDVRSADWYAQAVEWASRNNIVNGYGNRKFGPNDPLNREQFAALLYRYAQYKNSDTGFSGSLSGFRDSGRVSAYARDAVTWAVDKGLISGSNGYLDPAGSATRAQMAAILHRFCEKMN